MNLTHAIILVPFTGGHLSQKILRTAVIMRSWTLCLLLVATLASLLSTASVGKIRWLKSKWIKALFKAEFGGFKNSQNCPCECDCPGNGEKCECECECARQGSSCGPGFTQVCPSEDGSCPDNYMSLCPEDLTAAGRADTPLIEDRRRQRVNSFYWSLIDLDHPRISWLLNMTSNAKGKL